MSVEAKILCTPCVRDDKTVDAVKYCADCNENFCRTCLRQHIKQFASVSKQHKLLSRDEMPEWLKNASKTENNCTRHPDNELDSYCEDHEILCCGACVVIEHSSCENVKDLYQLFGETESEPNVEVLIQDLQEMINNFKDLNVSRRNDRSLLRKSTAKSLSNVRDLRKKVNDKFDELEKIAVDEINTECIKEDDAIESDLRQSEASITLLDMSLKQIRYSEKKSNKNLAESNISILNGQKLLNDMKQIREALRNKRNITSVNFVANQHLEKYVCSLKSIGTCKRSTGAKSASHVKMTGFSVHVEDDDAICDIQDAVQTKSGHFLILDAENKNIKILGTDLYIIKTFDLKVDIEKFDKQRTFEPFGICCVTDDDIAVSMVRDKVVNLYQMGRDSIQLTTDISVGEYCRGIVYSREKGELFVACGGGSYADEGLGQIRVYSIKGVFLRSFTKDRDGRIVSPQPMYLAISEDETKIYIADNYKGIITITVDGQYLNSFTSQQLAEARGICVDHAGDLIVCGYASNNVLRVNEDMKSCEILVTESDNVRNPQANVYDSFSSKCLISSNCSNEMHVFEV